MSDVPPQSPWGSDPPPPPPGGGYVPPPPADEGSTPPPGGGYRPPPPPPPGGGYAPPPPPGGGYAPPPPPPGGGYPPPPGGAYQYPPGASGYPQATAAWQGPPLAEYGQRVIAYLIDAAVVVVVIVAVVILGVIFGAISSALGAIVFILGYLVAAVYAFWNLAYLQGTTGQSIGKRTQGIALVREDTLQPVGFGMALVRYLVAGAISSVTCSIYGILDLLWPLWDPKRQRLTDKILKNAVIQAQKQPFDVKTLNPFQ